MVPILASIGCFTDSDWTIFAQYCGCIDRFHEARENVKVNGMTFETETGTKANPAVKIMQTSTDQIVRIGNMFGMSPSARVGLVGVPTDAARDDLERFKAEVG
jgi:P27 family predicted phage terminase small subunit